MIHSRLQVPKLPIASAQSVVNVLLYEPPRVPFVHAQCLPAVCAPFAHKTDTMLLTREGQDPLSKCLLLFFVLLSICCYLRVPILWQAAYCLWVSSFGLSFRSMGIRYARIGL